MKIDVVDFWNEVGIVNHLSGGVLYFWVQTI